MGLSLQDLQDAFFDELGMSVDDFPRGLTQVNGYINRSYWEVTQKFNFKENEVENEFTVGYDTSRIPLLGIISDFSSIRHVTVRDYNRGNTQWMPIKRADYPDFADKLNLSDSFKGIPEKYARDGTDLVLFPSPDTNYLIKVGYRKSLGDVGNNGPGIPQEWHEAILLGAVWRGWRAKGSPLRSQSAKNDQISIINSLIDVETKEQADNKYAAATVWKRKYP